VVGGCGLTVAPKDSCNTDADCNTGRACSPAKVCEDTPLDGGLPPMTDAGSPFQPDEGVPETGNPNPPDSGDEPVPLDSGSLPPPEDADHPVDAQGPPAACALPDGNIRELMTPADAAQAIVGRWALCSNQGNVVLFMNGRPLEFAADLHWYVLVPDGAGHLVRVSGLELVKNSGTYSFAPLEGGPGGATSVYVAFDWDGSGDEMLVTFSDVPADASPEKTSKMLMDSSVYVSIP
jgi:hypothetical protein